MSFLGGKVPVAATPTQLNSINISQSRYGDPVPLVYGVQRLKITLLWYGAFTSTAQYSNNSGKGGHGPPSSYAYTASCVMGLCEGPITAIKQVWKDKDLVTLTTEDLTLFSGAGGQAAWPYLVSNFPGQAVPYDHTAYIAEANLSLGGSAALPNYTFEVVGFLAQPGTAFSFVSGLAANSYQGQVSGTSPVPDGIWDVTFSDNESRTCTFTTTGGVTIVSWDTTLGLINGVSASAIAGGYDAEPSAVLVDYSTDPNHGAGFVSSSGASYLNTAQIQSHSWVSGGTTYYDSFKIYCEANNLLFSPLEDTQRPAADFIKDMLEMGNSNSVMSAGILNIVPYGDSSISGNGVTYTPNLTPLFSFTDDDFQFNNQGTINDPVVMTRKALTQTYNVVRVEFLDRGNSYNPALAEWTDPLDQAVNGIRVMPNKTFHQICDARVAHTVATLIGQRNLYIRNTYQFTVRPDYSILEPMDLVAITDTLVVNGVETRLGLVNKLVRIIEIEDDQDDIFTITAEEMFVGTASAPKYNFQSAQGYAANFAIPPQPVGTPFIFSAPAALIGPNGGYELWVAVGPGAAGEYGGAQAYGSADTVTYTYLGPINGQARYGAIPSSVGATDASINVTLTAAGAADGLQLSSASASDYANNRALIYLDGEVIGFENATLIGTGEYTLSPVTRGLFGTGPSSGVGLAHTAGAQWARLDETILRFAFDAGNVGQTVDFKFCAFNSVGRATQLLSAATAYSHVIEFAGGGILNGPLNFEAGGSAVMVGTSAFKAGSASAWDSSVYSTQSYTNGCSASCYASQTTGSNGVMLGLSTNPAASNSYTNLNYALYADGSANVQIYELGVLVGTFAATYTTSTLLNIVADGKHVAYYIGGALVRSVPITGLTLFLQIALVDQNSGVYGIDFSPTATAVTPFTLVPMATTVAAAGTRVISNGTGANGFGTKNFRSKESYSNGCFASASGAQTNGALFFGLSTAPATGGPSYGPITAGWYLHGDSNVCDVLFNGADVGTFGTGPLLTDVFTIAYDNFNFYWYRNNTLVLQKPYTNAGPLYLFGDFFEANLGFANVSFQPYSPSTPQQFIARGECVVADTNVSKIAGGTSSWTSGDAYSINGFPTCHFVGKANDTTHDVMMGLVSGAPPASINYTGLSYAINFQNGGTTLIYEAGVSTGVTGVFTANDYFAITYDGTTVYYVKNGAILRTVAAAGLTMFADVDVYLPGGGMNSLEFGPSGTIPLSDTGQINVNAATIIATASASSVSVPSSSIGSLTNITSVTVGPYPYATTVVCTATGQWSVGATGASSTVAYGIGTTTSVVSNSVEETVPGVSSNGGIATEVTFSLAANTTQTYYLNGQGLPGTSINSYTVVNVTLKAEVIKR